MEASGGGGGGKTMGKRPWRWANFNLAAICFFHFVLRFWNQVFIWTSVRLRVFDSSSRLDTDKYLSACKENFWIFPHLFLVAKSQILNFNNLNSQRKKTQLVISVC